MTDLDVSREVHCALASIDFRNVFQEHVAYVWNSLRRLGILEPDRDDLTQEVFMTVHALLEDYDPARPLRPWLFAITYRMVLRYRRKTWRQKLVLDDGEAASRKPATTGGENETQAREIVGLALDTMELHRRAVFVLAELDEYSIPEVATSLGIPLNTAYSRLRLARDDFRRAVHALEAEKGGAHG